MNTFDNIAIDGTFLHRDAQGVTSWQDPFPSRQGQDGKYLQVKGGKIAWEGLNMPTSVPVGTIIHVSYDTNLFTEPGWVPANGQTLGTFEGVPTNISQWYNLGMRIGRMKSVYGQGIDGFSQGTATLPTIQLLNTTLGAFTPAVDVTSGLTITVVSGSPTVAQITNITAKPANLIRPGSHFTIDGSGTAKWYVWFQIGGAGVDPRIAGRCGIPIQLENTAEANEVATAILNALLIARFKLPLINNGAFIRGGPIQPARGVVADPDYLSRVGGNVVGSLQDSQNMAHTHAAVSRTTISGPSDFSVAQSSPGYIAMSTRAPPRTNLEQMQANGHLVLNTSTSISASGGNQANPYNIMCTALIKY